MLTQIPEAVSLMMEYFKVMIDSWSSSATKYNHPLVYVGVAFLENSVYIRTMKNILLKICKMELGARLVSVEICFTYMKHLKFAWGCFPHGRTSADLSLVQ